MPRLTCAYLIVLALCSTCNADLIVSVDSVVNNELGEDAPLVFANAIDQSGLSVSYTSGDDYTTFINQSPTDAGTVDDIWNSNLITSGNIDLDLGSSFNLNGLVLWNLRNSRAVADFRILSSPDSSFTTTSLLGTFSASRDNGEPFDAQEFSFGQTNTRFVRFAIDSHHGSIATGFAELAFRSANSTAAVPEPSSIALVATSLGAFGFHRFRRRKKANN